MSDPTSPSGHAPLKVLVEGSVDQAIVESYLLALDIQPSLDVIVVRCGGKRGVKAAIGSMDMGLAGMTVALIDADRPSVADSVQWARRELGEPPIDVFCAVPTIEAWLFADKELAELHAKPNPSAKLALARMVTPEALPDPKEFAFEVFDRAMIKRRYPFLRDVNVGKAVAASASLHQFLRGVESKLGRSHLLSEQRLGDALNRQVFANLMRELPADTIGWRTLDGEYTAQQLGDRILQGDDVGLRYVTELLRLARDILAARAINRHHDD